MRDLFGNGVNKAETGTYEVPKFVVKPAEDDTGFALVKSQFNKGEKEIQAQNKKNARKKKIKSFDAFNESALLESQQFFFEDNLGKDAVDVSNVPGVSDPTAVIKWSLELAQNKSGIEMFKVAVKELHVKWDADRDLGEPGEAEVKTDKITATVDGSLENLYCEGIEFDNKTGEASVRFGKNKEE